MKKIKDFFRKLFPHHSVDEKIKIAIDDKLNARRREQVVETEKYNDVLNGYLRAYFYTSYKDNQEMAIAFETANKEWVALCKKVNKTNRLINIKKDAFADRVKLTIEQIKINNYELQKK